MASNKYSISAEALLQIEDLYFYGARHFGEQHAEMYYAGLEKTFELLADWPLIGGTADDFGTGYRRFRWKTHYIIYKPTDNDDRYTITVDKIIHTAMRSRSDPFEQD